MLIARGLSALVIASVTVAALALDPHTPISQYGHRAWQSDDGLPGSTVQAIAQTRDGYIWIGTQNGVTRFDGVTFTKFGKTSSLLREVFVFAFAVDRQGTLWIGSSGEHPLISYRGGSFSDVDLRALGVHDVFSLAAADDGAIWMGTNNGVVRLTEDGKRQQWTDKAGLPSPAVRKILIDRGGRVWAGTERGLARIDGATVIPAGKQIGLPDRPVRALFEDSRGRLWIGTSEGAYYTKGGVTYLHRALGDIASAFVASIIEDSNHTLWFGTNVGLKRLSYDDTGTPVDHTRLTGRFVLSLFEDREHAVWAGTFGGVDQLRDTMFVPWTREQGLRDHGVIAIAQGNRGSVWFGTFGGLGRLHPDGKLEWFSRKEGLANETIISLTPAHDGGVWAGTYGGGVCRAGAGPIRCYGTANGLTHGVVTSIIEDEDRSLWLATLGGGLNHLKDGRVTAYGTQQGLPSLRVVTMSRARDGGLWLGMINEGLVHFRNGNFTRHLHLADKPVSVRSIVEDADGGLWIGSDDPGFLYAKNGVITTFPLARFLPDVCVNWIVEQNGFIWLTTRNGIARIAKEELLRFARNETRVFHPMSFTSADGLRSSEFSTGQPSAVVGSDGTMWFNGKRGAAMLPRGALERRNTIAPRVVLESATAGELPLTSTAPDIHSRRARVMFRYTAINFNAPDQLVFRYRLDGYDHAWIDAGTTRTAEYMNLPPGQYTFRVMAANADRNWKENSAATLHFTRQPEFRETWTFYFVCASLLALAAGLIYYARMRLMREREAELVRRIDERTREQRTILDAAGEGIFGLNGKGIATFVNPSAARTLGAPIEELIGRPLHELIHAKSDEHSLPALDACPVCSTTLNPPMRVSKAATFVQRSGKSIPVEYTSNTVTDENGARTGVVVTFRDITERHSVERLKSEFVSTVSHELRTPLTSIRGALGLIAGGMLAEVSPRMQKMLDIAVNNTDRLVRLINDILDVERIDSGRVELNRRVVDAHDLMLQAVDVMTAIADRAAIRLVIEPMHATLWVDSDRIVQTLTNLLGNAIKFSTRGSTVTLSAATNEREFAFLVADQGRGIPSDKLETIFERFKQVDASDSRDKGGTGLGLAICRSIAAAHGGRIWAESRVGMGSVFHFAVPMTNEWEVSGAA